MRSAIIGGTGIYNIPGGKFQEEIIDTQYGKARVVFLEKSNMKIWFSWLGMVWIIIFPRIKLTIGPISGH